MKVHGKNGFNASGFPFFFLSPLLFFHSLWYLPSLSLMLVSIPLCLYLFLWLSASVCVCVLKQSRNGTLYKGRTKLIGDQKGDKDDRGVDKPPLSLPWSHKWRGDRTCLHIPPIFILYFFLHFCLFLVSLYFILFPFFPLFFFLFSEFK